MFRFNRFMAIFVTIAMLGPTLPLEAKTRKGDKLLAEGRAHEEKKEWDAALEAYEKALSQDPSELVYQMAAQKARFEASAMHVTNGTKIRAQGQLGEALLEFQKAYALNPASTVAEQEILRTQEMIERERRRVEQTGVAAPPEVRGLTPSETANKETEDRIDRLLPVPELKPLNPRRQDFTMRNQPPKVIFDTLAVNAGLNIIYDPEYLSNGPKDKLDITFKDATVQEALDDLALRTKSYWKPINSNTIFVTMDNANKRRDYEDEETRIFYLRNTTANADLTAIVTAIRTVADLQRLFPFESQNAIIAKGSADKMALAEKIIHDLDKPKSEVVVDIYVLEASSVYMRTLATGIATTGLNLAGNFTPRSSLHHFHRHHLHHDEYRQHRRRQQHHRHGDSFFPHRAGECGRFLHRASQRALPGHYERHAHQSAAVSATPLRGWPEGQHEDRRKGAYRQRQLRQYGGRHRRGRQPPGEHPVHLPRRGRQCGNPAEGARQRRRLHAHQPGHFERHRAGEPGRNQRAHHRPAQDR
jgi:tetratricopeptide (TPR) repeat protein